MRSSSITLPITGSMTACFYIPGNRAMDVFLFYMTTAYKQLGSFSSPYSFQSIILTSSSEIR